MSKILFISGIDTDAGKTFATGWLAREMRRGGVKTVTQKPIQTGCGCTGGAANSLKPEVFALPSGCDIIVHREIMGCGLLPEDREGLTAPEIFPYPASPHLASKLAGREIDFAKIDAASRALAERYDVVLVEGAGGLMTPLTENYSTIDFIRERGYPVVFVTSAKLGSINHTLLALDALRARGMSLQSLLFNSFPETDPIIAEETQRFLRRVIERDWKGTEFKIVPNILTSE